MVGDVTPQAAIWNRCSDSGGGACLSRKKRPTSAAAHAIARVSVAFRPEAAYAPANVSSHGPWGDQRSAVGSAASGGAGTVQPSGGTSPPWMGGSVTDLPSTADSRAWLGNSTIGFDGVLG